MNIINWINTYRKMKQLSDYKKILLRTKDQWVMADLISEESANVVISSELNRKAKELFGKEAHYEVV